MMTVLGKCPSDCGKPRETYAVFLVRAREIHRLKSIGRLKVLF